MILETDVDDTRCSEQIVDAPVPQIAERIVAVVAALHGSESQNESLLGSSTCQDTQSFGANHQRFSISRSKLRTHRMQRWFQDTSQQ